jgi:hypothetical protein
MHGPNVVASTQVKEGAGGVSVPMTCGQPGGQQDPGTHARRRVWVQRVRLPVRLLIWWLRRVTLRAQSTHTGKAMGKASRTKQHAAGRNKNGC